MYFVYTTRSGYNAEMCADSSGILQWQKNFGHQYQAEDDRLDKVISVQQTSDGGYMVLAVKRRLKYDIAPGYFEDDLGLMKIEGD